MEHQLYHHGILGQKWGVRRFQNSDGSYTSEGKKRYGKDKSSKNKKKAIAIGAAAVGTALAVCGTYHLAKSGKLDGLISIGRSAVQNLSISDNGTIQIQFNGESSGNRKRNAAYERWAAANDARIRNHGRL